ncbi:MAG: AAA family ATPase [Bacteroidales bacterium]|nr:AAA family ATPase [Bacteroidales bacterium]
MCACLLSQKDGKVSPLAWNCEKKYIQSDFLKVEMMIVKKLKIENFRGIRNLELNFDESRMVAFIGFDTAVKTAVLAAMRYLLSWYVARLMSSMGRGIQIELDDIDGGEGFGYLEMTVQIPEFENRMVRWSLLKKRSSCDKKIGRSANRGELNDFVDSLLMRRTDGSEQDLSLVAFYPADRAVKDVPLQIHDSEALDPLDAFDGFRRGTENFHSLFRWLREREDLENEKRRDAGEGFTGDVQLNAFRTAIEVLLPGYRNFRVKRDTLSLMVEKNGTLLSFDLLPEEEMNYVALMSDIARRLTMANPEASSLFGKTAIVMIDEIELNTNPELQSGLVSRLKKAFPQVQFFLTTQSPRIAKDLDCCRDSLLFNLDGKC